MLLLQRLMVETRFFPLHWPRPSLATFLSPLCSLSRLYKQQFLSPVFLIPVGECMGWPTYVFFSRVVRDWQSTQHYPAAFLHVQVNPLYLDCPLQPFPMCSKSPLFGLSSNHLDSYNTKWWHWTLNQSKTLLLESTVSIVVYHVAYKCFKDLSFSLNTVRVKARLTLPPQAAPERILRWARRNTSLSHSMCTG